MRPSQIILIVFLLYPSVHSKDSPEIQCIMNQYKQMTCLWNQHGVPSVNYTFQYWLGKKNEETTRNCTQYLLNGNTNIGCFIKEEIEPFSPFTAELNHTSLEKPIKIHYEITQNIVKLEPPFDLHVENTSSRELLLKWNTSHSLYPLHCYEFQVQHRSSTNEKWTLKDVSSSEMFSLPSFDPEKSYTFHVRSKLNGYCSSAMTWSDWSMGVTWGRNATRGAVEPPSSAITNLLIYIMSTSLLLFFLILLFRVERIWVIFVPRIPNPGKNFEDLFTKHQGNFQEWIGISKEGEERLKQNYSEPICTVTEDYDSNIGDAKTPLPV
uniref:Fibronectin type-III domain-containing protein n=1 Tax=Leptobrachium leishanense TaxID=445787 RepID=A0A8C5WDW9_9ANUR